MQKEVKVKMRVLYLEDNPYFSRMVAKMLDTDEYELAVFSDVPCVKHMIAGRIPFDIFICTDAKVKGEDAGALAEELRTQGRKVLILGCEGRGSVPFMTKINLHGPGLRERLREL